MDIVLALAAPIVLKAGLLVAGAEATPIPSGMVVIEGDRIRGVGAHLPVPDGASLLDLGGLTLVPGLIDAHSHLCLDVLAGNEGEQVKAPDVELVLRVARHGARDLEAGTTTMRV
ncbi:MAG TPA: amidohydrolase family protein, partial [Vicinamibacteria bacterium]